MRAEITVTTVADNVWLADWSTRARSCNVRTNQHGFESLEIDLDLPFYEAFNYYQQFGPLKIRAAWGSYRIWEGRIEDPTQLAGDHSGLKVTALGAWSAFNDLPYSALWSDTAFDRWDLVDNRIRPGVGIAKDMYAIDMRDRLYVSLQKNATYGNATDYAELFYQIPNLLSSRDILGISFDIETNLPNNWRIELNTRNTDFTGVTNQLTITTTGAVIVRSYNFSFTGKPLIDFIIYNNTGGNYTNLGETGDFYVVMTNIRVVSSVANRIDTTFTVARAAGANVTATVGSNARMYVGQRLNISNAAGTVGESVTILSLTSTNQFNATFLNAYAIGDTVRAYVIYPDEVIKHLVAVYNVANTTEISNVTSAIQSQAIDIDLAVFEDQYMTEIINDMIALGDTSTRQWVALIYEDRQLLVRPRGSGQVWYTDVSELEIARSLAEMFNSVYTIYPNPNEAGIDNLRTAITTDPLSISKYGITRRKAYKVETSIYTQAATVRNTLLEAQKDPIPRATIKIDRIMDQYDNVYPLFMARADDILILRNLPPILGTTYDKIRSLVIVGTDYDMLSNTLSLDLELPIPQVEVQIAKALKG